MRRAVASATAVSVDILPARAARLTAAQTGGESGDTLAFHAQLATQGTSCCGVERSGQNFVQVTGFTSFPAYFNTAGGAEQGRPLVKTAYLPFMERPK